MDRRPAVTNMKQFSTISTSGRTIQCTPPFASRRTVGYFVLKARSDNRTSIDLRGYSKERLWYALLERVLCSDLPDDHQKFFFGKFVEAIKESASFFLRRTRI
jgi:hypothetical protein